MLELLFLAQHHGVPTRLLDWTTNPLVAAYFAVECANLSTDAAIYAVPIPEKGKLIALVADFDPFKAEKIVAIRPPHSTPRVLAQSSIFTLHPNPEEASEPEGLVKAVIPRSACARMKLILDHLGVSRGTLFPGLDGIAADIAWQLNARWLSTADEAARIAAATNEVAPAQSGPAETNPVAPAEHDEALDGDGRVG
jgi:hypothetical protein